MIGQIGGRSNASPADLLTPEPAPTDGRMRFSERDHELEKPENIGVLLQSLPVQPSRFVILIVRVVVTSLGMQKFVSGRKHRNSVRKHQEAKAIFGLSFPQGDDLRRGPVISFPSIIKTIIV